MVLTKQQIVDWLLIAGELMKENEALLTELDSPIGDADHGRNMARGFNQARVRIKTVADKDIGTILKTAAMSLMSASGGACGQLYANFFLRGAGAVVAKEQLTLQDLVDLFNAGLEGVFQRGRALPGEKTIVDALGPATEAMQAVADISNNIQQALDAGLAAAEQGMQSTVLMQAKKGRASYLGERSVGHQDPGATSAFFIFQALHRAGQAKTS